jgi:hypothetical protein
MYWFKVEEAQVVEGAAGERIIVKHAAHLQSPVKVSNGLRVVVLFVVDGSHVDGRVHRAPTVAGGLALVEGLEGKRKGFVKFAQPVVAPAQVVEGTGPAGPETQLPGQPESPAGVTQGFVGRSVAVPFGQRRERIDPVGVGAQRLQAHRQAVGGRLRGPHGPRGQQQAQDSHECMLNGKISFHSSDRHWAVARPARLRLKRGHFSKES